MLSSYSFGCITNMLTQNAMLPTLSIVERRQHEQLRRPDQPTQLRRRPCDHLEARSPLAPRRERPEQRQRNPAIEKILRHLNLSPEPPKVHPARAYPEQEEFGFTE